VREDHEWANGYLPGAVHMGRGIIERDVETKVPDTGTKMILYCGGGFRSALVADNLQKMGYTNVESMDGGWRGWTEAGLPVQKD
jgi:rhodanese-related sulfurtransferase